MNIMDYTNSMHQQNLKTISDIILKNELYILPLYSIREGICSCGKEDCTAPGKHPLFRYNWKIIASNKPDKVLSWLEAYNKMNFGLATGRLSKVTNKYLIVIDVDAQEHPFIKTLPNTFSYRTGSGGWHFWFWSKYPVKNSVSFLADKVDVRGTDGYVVIPPSKHYKGLYNNINNVEIADLPKPILSKLLEKPTISAVSKSRKKSSPSIASVWATDPVPKIRDMMQTQFVPEGVRNVVMHRLLSSDRARGALKTELKKNARSYLKRFDKPQELSSELDTIVESVMKYPAYNNSHDKVNELYISWLKKNKNVIVSKVHIDSLNAEDKRFFSLLQATDIKNHRVTLNQIIDCRMDWLKAQGLKHISNYKSQLLAKKLVELGFQRHRTAKGNWWNVFLPEIPIKQA
jgi:hypothetical protein